VGILFTAAAVMGSALFVYSESPTFSRDTLRMALVLGSTLMVTFGARMAAVFTLSVTTIGLRTRLVPRWLSVIGVACTVALVLTPPAPKLTQLVFPIWVLILSLHILLVSVRPPAPGTGGGR
jgi:Na+/phosphate symporter